MWARVSFEDETATKIQKMFRSRMAWKLFRFIISIPDLHSKKTYNTTNKIQKLWRGYSGRKMVRYLKGEYVAKPSLRMRIKEKGGDYRFLSYVYRGEDELAAAAGAAAGARVRADRRPGSRRGKNLRGRRGIQTLTFRRRSGSRSRDSR